MSYLEANIRHLPEMKWETVMRQMAAREMTCKYIRVSGETRGFALYGVRPDGNLWVHGLYLEPGVPRRVLRAVIKMGNALARSLGCSKMLFETKRRGWRRWYSPSSEIMEAPTK